VSDFNIDQSLKKKEELNEIFNDDALEELAGMAFQISAEVENIGARRLHTVMSKLLNELLFDVPDKIGPNAKIVVTKDMVTEKLAGLIKNKDLSHYIL
jgi:ATP-dependent HslUV protease ATP-binding subunit HslU